jgi:hypothetical protein
MTQSKDGNAPADRDSAAATAAAPGEPGDLAYRVTVIETPDEPVRRRFEDLPPAAQRALLEAETRRREIDARAEALPPEVDGRGGLEPTRYEDWEIKGITSDF